MSTIAWDYLSPLERAELLAMRPDLKADYDKHQKGEKENKEDAEREP